MKKDWDIIGGGLFNPLTDHNFNLHSDVLYADDLALVAQTSTELQHMLGALHYVGHAHQWWKAHDPLCRRTARKGQTIPSHCRPGNAGRGFFLFPWK